MKTLVYNIHGFDKPSLENAAQNKHELVFTDQRLNIETANLAKGFEAIALFTSDNASADVLEKLLEYGVRFMALRSAGHDHVDLAKAKQLGIKVANVPAYSPYAIAEHAVAMLLALNRKLILGQQLMQQNDYRLDDLVGFDLHGKTVGIIGTGKVGAAFANIMHGFGCTLFAFDIEESKQLIGETNIAYTSFQSLCEKSDVISIHCPLNSDTKYLFNKTSFSKMKPGMTLINTARGSIVNTVDLLDAIDKGIVAAAGLDVYEAEKPIFFDDHSTTKISDALFLKLRSYPTILITGHQAFLTNEALQGIAETTIANLDGWAKNGAAENELY
jgi:D-lactate dehydrogenase